MTWKPTSFLLVFNFPITVTAEEDGFDTNFWDGRGRPSLHCFRIACKRRDAYQFPALLFTFGGGGLHHARRHGFERVGHCCLSFDGPRAFD